MTAAWPITLPQAIITDGFSNDVPDNRIHSSPDFGPALVRGRTSSNVSLMSDQMIMTTAQWGILKTFITTDLSRGALPFTFPDPDKGADLLVRFAKGGLPVRQGVSDGVWRVGFLLEVMP